MDDGFIKRKHPRLKQFDYSTNACYFVTICTKERQCFLGKIVGAAYTPPAAQPKPQMIYSAVGKIALRNLVNIPSHFDDSIVEKYVVMPNHLHMIISIGCKDKVPAGGIYAAPTNKAVKLTTIINAYKASVTREYGKPIWQRSFYEHIIRGEKDYLEIWQYIDGNPQKWLNNKSKAPE